MVHYLDCQYIANVTNGVTRGRIRKKTDLGFADPTLMLLNGSNAEDDLIFSRMLKKTAKDVGIEVFDAYTQSDIDSVVKGERVIDGYVSLSGAWFNLQYDRDRSLSVDGGFGTPYEKAVVEATMKIFDQRIVSTDGDAVLVIGRSDSIGKVIARRLLGINKTVIVAHSKTGDQRLKSLCDVADVVVSTAPYGTKFRGDLLHGGQILIDIGNNFDLSYWENLQIDAGSIATTPKIGGIGVITRAIIMERVVSNYEERILKELN